MTEANRVFITGFSALTATGLTAEDTWNAVLQGKSGLAPLTEYDLSSWTHRLGGEIKPFEPARLLPDRKLLKVISRQDVLGIHAAIKAVEHSQCIPYRDTLPCQNTFNEETAIYVGSPGNKYYQQYDFLPLLAKTKGDMKGFADELFNEVHPMWLLRILPNNVLAYTGMTYGFKGINQNVTNHAVSGTQAIIEAYHAIKQGQAARAVVVAYDVAQEPQGLYYYEKLGVISKRHLKPFDKAHDGTLLAEGAGALILESEASVKARGAACYAEVIGGFSATEQAGLFSIESEGDSLSQLLKNTLEHYHLEPTDISALIAHGNGNQKSDTSEALAISKVFGAGGLKVSAFKWAIGHTVCASGILDAVLTTYALKEKCLPGVANLDSLAPDCVGVDVSKHHRSLEEGSYAMMINRGFASMNACLVMKACG